MQKFRNKERGFIETVMIVSTIVTIITLSVASKVYEMNKQAEEKYPAPQGSIFNDIKESIVKSVSKSPSDLGKTPSNTEIRSNSTYSITTNTGLSSPQQNSSNSQTSSNSEAGSTSSGSSNSSSRRSGGGGGSSSDSGSGDNSNTAETTNNVSNNTGNSETTTSGTENTTNQQTSTNSTTQTTTNYSAARPSLPSFVAFDSLRFDESGKAAPEGYDRLQISFTTTDQGVPPLGTNVISLDSNDIFSPISSLIQIPVFLGKSSGNINKKIDDFESGIFVRRNYPEVEILFKGGSPTDRSKTRFVLKTNSDKNISCKGIYLDKGEDVLRQINSEICEAELEMGGGINGLYDGILITYSDPSSNPIDDQPNEPEPECKVNTDCNDNNGNTKDTCQNNSCVYTKIAPTEPIPSEPITEQKTFYIDPNSKGGPCSDSNPGTTTTSPWCSLSKVRSLTAGQTAYIRESTIESGLIQIQKKSGDAKKPITIKNYPNEKVVFSGTTIKLEFSHYFTIEGINFENRGGVNILNSNYVTVKNNNFNKSDVKIWGENGSRHVQVIGNTFDQCYTGEIKDDTGSCITAFIRSDNLLIEGNKIKGGGHAGIDLAIDATNYQGDDDKSHDNVTVRRNEIYENYFLGLAMSGGLTNYTIEYNNFHDNCLYSGAHWKTASKLNGTNGKFQHNYVNNNKCNGLSLQAWASPYIFGDDKAENNRIENNIFINNENGKSEDTRAYDIEIRHVNWQNNGLKKTSNNEFRDNTLSGIRFGVFDDKDYNPEQKDFYGNIFERNIFLDDEKIKLKIDFADEDNKASTTKYYDLNTIETKYDNWWDNVLKYYDLNTIETKYDNWWDNIFPGSVSINQTNLLDQFVKFINIPDISNMASLFFSIFKSF